MSSAVQPDPLPMRGRERIALGCLVAVPLALVGAFSVAVHGVSLDDAYITFVHARNLVEHREWALNPGTPSFGTSSVLWTLLLAFALKLGIDPIQSSRALGGLGAGATVALAYLLTRELGRSRFFAAACATVLVTTTPLLLLALSGMEAVAHTALFLAVALELVRRQLDRPWLLGTLSGLLFLNRPDAVVLVPVLFLAAIATLGLPWRHSSAALPAVRSLLKISALSLLIAAPWLGFLYQRTGQWVPLSYHAKLYSMPGAPETLGYSLSERTRVALEYAAKGYLGLLDEAGLPWLPLLAAILVVLATSLGALASRQRLSPELAVWTLLGLALALPLEYGWKDSWWYGGYAYRYIFPVMPILAVLGATGLARLLRRSGEQEAVAPGRSTWRPPFRRLLLLFVAAALGWRSFHFAESLASTLDSYRFTVELNEVYRRSIAEWLRENTPPDARIADTHLGVGALAYYSQRYVIDQGGLADQGILDFWRRDGDPGASMAETFAFFDSRRVKYLVASLGLENGLSGKLEPLVTISRPGVAEPKPFDFDTTVVFRYHWRRDIDSPAARGEP